MSREIGSPGGPPLVLIDSSALWSDKVACKDADPKLFESASPGEYGGRQQRAYPARVLGAIVWCVGCPVTKQCYDLAFQTRAMGVWGGVYRRKLRDDTSGGQAWTLELHIDPNNGEVLREEIVKNPKVAIKLN